MTAFRQARPRLLASLTFITAAVLGVCEVAAAQSLPPAERILHWSGDEQLVGFRSIDQIFPTRTVRRGSRVRSLPAAQQQIAPVYEVDDERGSVEDYMRRERIVGMLVISHGKIVLERYALGQRPSDRWISFSIAKSVTSTLLGAAIRDGKIGSVDDLVTTYIPELQGTAYDGVKLRDVLAMRSGVSWNEDYADPSSDVSRLAASMALNKGASLIGLMAKLSRADPPGTRFRYSTGESNLIGIIVSRATGEPLAKYLSRKIWRPYGMESDANWLTDGGIEVGGCCLSMTLRDYGRLGLFAMDQMKADTGGPLPAGWMTEATSSKSEPDETPYGYQWWIPSSGSFAALGIFGQTVYVNPARQLVFVQLAAWPVASGKDHSARRLAFAAAIERSVDVPASAR